MSAIQASELQDKNGKVIRFVDEGARKTAAENGQKVNQLSEEIAAISGGQEIVARVTDAGSVQAYYAGNGVLVENAKALTTDYVEINGQNIVRYDTSVALGNLIVTFFDDAKNLLKNGSIMAEGSTTLHREGSAKIPTGAKYARLSSYSNDQAQMTLYKATHVLSGKKVAVLGDSISSVDYTLPNYWQMISEATGCAFANYGVSASRIAASDGAIAESFVTRYVNMTTDADAVIIMGGTNDANNSQLGEWDSTDTSTLYGALNTMLPDLCVRYPGKPILFFAPIRGKEETLAGLPPTYADLAEKTATDTLKLRLVRLAIKAKCEQYGIPFIETDKISGINGNDTDGIYYIDALHPSAHGVACLANVVQAELEKRFVYTVD